MNRIKKKNERNNCSQTIARHGLRQKRKTWWKVSNNAKKSLQRVCKAKTIYIDSAKTFRKEKIDVGITDGTIQKLSQNSLGRKKNSTYTLLNDIKQTKDIKPA